MTWTPAYQATYSDPLIRQLIALIQRDQRAALDFVGGTGVLPDIQDYQLAAESLPTFPYLWIYDDDLIFDQDAVGSRHYVVKLYAEIAVAHQDYQQLAILRRLYANAIDALLMTMSVQFSDFFVGQQLTLPTLGPNPVTTTPLQAGSVKELFVTRHRLGRIGALKGTGGFAASTVIEFIVDREEI